MKIYFKFDFNILTKKTIAEKLKALNINFLNIGFGEVELSDDVSSEKFEILSKELNKYVIEIIENQKDIMVQKIKDTILEMINSQEPRPFKGSIYLAEKLNQNYSFLAGLFSEVTHTSIENFTILQKIEVAKTLIINNQYTLTEIAYKLNYSSVAHLSTQFKNTTGITPSAF